mgnify:CR=1 FL=1
MPGAGAGRAMRMTLLTPGVTDRLRGLSQTAAVFMKTWNVYGGVGLSSGILKLLSLQRRGGTGWA